MISGTITSRPTALPVRFSASTAASEDRALPAPVSAISGVRDRDDGQPRKPSIGLNPTAPRARSARRRGSVFISGAAPLPRPRHGCAGLEELVQRRVGLEQTNRDWAGPFMISKQLDEVGAAASATALPPRSAGTARLLVLGEDHLLSAHRADARLLEDIVAPIVLGTAEADAYHGAELDLQCGLHRSGVSPLTRTPILRTWSAHFINVLNSPESSGSIIGMRPASTWPSEPSMVR